jgi:hypothetical protein
LKISNYFFALFRSSSSHVHFLRSAGLLHPQYRFIPLHFARSVTLHSSSIISVALYFFSGCSFAQPSGLAPFREKRHFALNQGTPPAIPYFFPAVSRSFSFILRLVPRQLQFSASGGCSIAATPPLRSSSRPKRTRLRCLGVFDCRFHNNVPRRTSTRR